MGAREARWPLDDRPRRRAWRGVARYTVWTALVILVAVPVAVASAPAHRAGVIRVAAAVVVSIVLLDLIRSVRALHDAEPRSAFDAALRPPSVAAPVDRHFKEVQDEIRAAAASETYFSRVLWPRLVATADRLPGRPALVRPARSRGRGWLRRGPSVAQLRRLVADLEDGA